MFLYKLFLWIYPLVAKIISPFNEKAKQWTIGQKYVWNEIANAKQQILKPIIWVHCASYGEFEQGLPIIEALRRNYPNYQIWLTFFSPSGYLHRKNDTSVDVVTYLPFDDPKNATKFIETLQPKLIVFIKYEFWYYYLTVAKNKQIPTILASAIFRPTQIFFKPYGRFFKEMLSLYNCILVQDPMSYKLVAPLLKGNNIRIVGDTRFDRVIITASQTIHYDWIKRISNYKNIIAGSTWENDHQLLAETASNLNALNWIIVPHDVSEASIQAAKKIFPNAITFSEFEKVDTIYDQPIILIIDRIGMLRSLYQYAHISYVGGGFGKDGVHNVLEPAVFGKPVIWGKEDTKFIEAAGLKNAGGGFSINNEAGFKYVLNYLLNDTIAYNNASHNAAQFILNNAGATEKTINYIQENRLLTN
jgi:3-deoxy-D-manno-octulosonic-acid transferase